MTLTAVLFAGGESRRMGADKAGLPIAGEPLWARQFSVLRELKPDALLVSARNRPAWCSSEIRVVIDESPSRGPLSGLAAALKKIQTTHLLALAVDLPNMTAAHLQRLWQLARPQCGVMPSLDGNLEPLCAIYPGGDIAVATAKNLLAGDDWSLQQFAKVLASREQLELFPVLPDDRIYYMNVNTPEEFSRMKTSDAARGS